MDESFFVDNDGFDLSEGSVSSEELGDDQFEFNDTFKVDLPVAEGGDVNSRWFVSSDQLQEQQIPPDMPRTKFRSQGIGRKSH